MMHASILTGSSRKLLRDMASFMDPEADYLAIVATEEQTALAENKRKRELEQAYTDLKGSLFPMHSHGSGNIDNFQSALSRILDAARVSSTRPGTVPSAEEHAAILNEQDANRFQLAKAINDAEGLLASKEAELTALKEETKALEERDPALEHEKDLNGTA
jgi:kinetochore protein Spc24, fungi type